MLHIRTVKTKDKYCFVQVYRYENGNRVIVKHIGSGKTDNEIKSLIKMAKVFIRYFTRQSYLFEEVKPQDDSVLLSQCDFAGVYYHFFYDTIRSIQYQIGYGLTRKSQ
jgi:hypothetical protein